MRGDLPVYREIGGANGTAYPEVRMALSGSTTPMLLVNEKGEQIVSLAVPIQYRKAVQGVLLLSTRPGEIDEILSEERNVILVLALTAFGGHAARLASCSPAPLPAPCAGCRRRPRTSVAQHHRRATSCPSSPTAPTRSARWPPPSAR